MFEKNEDYFEDSFYSETNVPFEGVNFSLYKSSLINIFICCVILFTFSKLLKCGIPDKFFYFFYSLFAFFIGPLIIGFVVDKVDTKKITMISFFVDGIALLLLSLSFLKSNFIFYTSSIWLGISTSIKACAFVKTFAYWTSKKERAFAIFFFFVVAHFLSRIISEMKIGVGNLSLFFTILAFICIFLGFFFLKKMVSSPATLGLPNIEEYRNSNIIETPELSRENSLFMINNGDKENIFKNIIFLKLLLVLAFLNMIPTYIAGSEEFWRPHNFWYFAILLILAFLSNKLFNFKRVPIVQYTLVVLLCLRLSLLVLPLSQSVTQPAYCVLFVGLSAVKTFLIYLCIIEAGKKYCTASRFGICTAVYTIAPHIAPYILPPLVISMPKFTDWFGIIISLLAIIVLGSLRKNNI